MPTTLDPLTLFELSLVDEPANIDSRVTIFKRRDKQEISDMTRMEELEGQVADIDAKLDQIGKTLQGAIARQRAEPREPRAVVKDFETVVEEMRSNGLSNLEALRKARRSAPKAFQAFQADIVQAPSGAVAKSSAMIEFEDIVDEIASKEKCSATAALVKARKAFPDAFEAYREDA